MRSVAHHAVAPVAGFERRNLCLPGFDTSAKSSTWRDRPGRPLVHARSTLALEVLRETKSDAVWFFVFRWFWQTPQHHVELADMLDQLRAPTV